MTHTPGKWTAECEHIVARDDAGLVNNANNSIARLYGPDVDDNATLIAAAPELLEKSKKLANEVRGTIALLKDQPQIVGWTNIACLEQRLNNLDDEIAKAEGGAE